MDVLGLDSAEESQDWPSEAEEKYERLEVLGKGSFGMVWMARRVAPAVDGGDDEFVAIKNIHIKDNKGSVYAEREIGILRELRHPNIIRLIRAYDLFNSTRLVVMQLARGPNLHQLVVKRGALGLPLCRLVARQLIAAVGYMHGRAVIHRDIKPSNCILARTDIPPRQDYDWYFDDAIWKNGKEADLMVQQDKWKLMLVDFGFSRALEKSEIETPPSGTKRLRNSIVFERESAIAQGGRGSVMANSIAAAAAAVQAEEDGDDDENGDLTEEDLDRIVQRAAKSMKGTSFEPINELEDEIMGSKTNTRKRNSGVSMPLPTKEDRTSDRRTSRAKVLSMSALGTKAYAAPEIRKKLRQKNDEDLEKANAAMTECVADYGMIVDAYSVGWTLRVSMTGVPPNFTLSEYMKERESVVLEGEEEELVDSCCCMKGDFRPFVKVREPSMLPYEATLLIATMTEKKPELRLTVREAQLHPYITGNESEEPYSLPQGDIPSGHGDPVIPLKCAPALSKLTVEYHMQ